MKILITGGAGYIGSILVPLLLKEGHEVEVIDNFMYNQMSLLECCYDKRLIVRRGDARDKDLIRTAIKKADAVFPLACITGAPACQKDPLTARTVNYEAIKILLELRGKDQIVIFPTTNSGYGIGQEGIHCTEETPLQPISLYGKLKVDTENAVLDAGNSIALRLATAFGISPRMRIDLLVNDFVYRAVTDGFIILFQAHFKRNFVHVQDIAKAFIHSINNFGNMKNKPYNVGLSNANLSKLELCHEIKKQIPKFHYMEEDIGEDPDKRNYIVSNAKIETTGYKAEISLEDGIRELIKGYQIIRRNQYSNI